jgi:hypothetical protein
MRKSHGASCPTGQELVGHALHVVLTADDETLRPRIQGGDEGHEWRMAHLERFRTARSWVSAAADLVVDTLSCDAAHAAEVIAAWMRRDSKRMS